MASTSELMLRTSATDTEQHGTNTQQRASARRNGATAVDAEQHGANTQQPASAASDVMSAADAGRHRTNSQQRPSAIGEVTLEAIEVGRLAGLDVYPGARFFTKGPRRCAVECDGVVGNSRGGYVGATLLEGTEVVILEAVMHVISERRYVAARIHSVWGGGYGWIMVCCETRRFVIPERSMRDRSRAR